MLYKTTAAELRTTSTIRGSTSILIGQTWILYFIAQNNVYGVVTFPHYYQSADSNKKHKCDNAQDNHWHFVFFLLLTGLSSWGVRHYSHYGHHRCWHPGHGKVIVIRNGDRDYRYHQKL